MHNSFAGKRAIWAIAVLLILVGGCSEPGPEVGVSSEPGSSSQKPSEDDSPASQPVPLDILYPLDGALFPPEIAAPTFHWAESHPNANAWQIALKFSDGEHAMEFRSREAAWTVPDAAWETIKQHSKRQEVRATISGVCDDEADQVLSQGSVGIRTSDAEVGAPLFFREVNLPFNAAVKNPAAYIRWRFGPISSKGPPPIVLEKLPVCGNCHSFSADGSLLGMDVDYANDKGSYAIATVGREMTLDKEGLITWSDYKREDNEETFGLLSRVSPNGRYVASTVKDRSVFVAKDDLAFSQLFFPIKGILVYCDRQTGAIHPLPGADDPRFVQSNPTWSPDGTQLVFARSKVHHLKNLANRKSALLTKEDCEEFLKGGKEFLYDLYRIPFNNGKGGKAEPIEGASNNGMSNYFAKFSPDGKWIVFCKAKSFMLLQPDSELYIIPAAGGEARRLRCNTSRMNSWHSWSPNGKWLVFSSKAYSPYTQLFLTHIDAQGRSSVPVVLSRFTEPERAANIPEFVNRKPDSIQEISVAFIDDHNLYRAAFEFIKQGDPAGAVLLLERSLEVNPKNVASRLELAAILANAGQAEEAKAHLAKIFALEPGNLEPRDLAEAHHQLASVLYGEQRLLEAADHCRQAIEKDPDFGEAHANFGLVLLDLGHSADSLAHLRRALRLGPKDGFSNYAYGHYLHRAGKLAEAADHYERAIEQNPKLVAPLLGLASIRILVDQPELSNVEEALAHAEKACELTRHRNADALNMLAGAYAVARRFDEAASTARTALAIAREAGDRALAGRIQKMLAVYERLQAEQGK